MKTLNRFIIEKLKLGKDTQINNYNFYPKDFDELRSLLEQLLEERGKDADLNDIDVSQVTSFGNRIKTGKYEGYWGLFYGLDPHNINISEWGVSNVKDMENMFYKCENFNCDLSNWDVSNVKNMQAMFRRCKKFTGKGLENWDVSNIKNMAYMFFECENFNCDLSNWDVNNVKDMHSMFVNCKNFNCDLSNWDISNVKDMRWMFDGCDSLKNIPSWYKE